MNAGVVAAAAGAGYVAGSVPFGLLLLRLAGGPDPRRVGSGNIGATNVTRAGGRMLGALTLALDVAKAALPVGVATRLGPGPAAACAAGAVMGHCFPVWLRFSGGKGVATLLGASAALAWPVAALAFLGAWGAMLLASRIVSVSSLAASWTAPVAAGLAGAGAPAVGALCVGAALVTFRHRANLRRLRRGEEPRVGSRRAESAVAPRGEES